MEKYIPFEKLSKKKKREMNAKQRSTWGCMNPVTRKPNPPKAYNRRKALKWNDDSSSVPFSNICRLNAIIGTRGYEKCLLI